MPKSKNFLTLEDIDLQITYFAHNTHSQQKLLLTQQLAIYILYEHKLEKPKCNLVQFPLSEKKNQPTIVTPSTIY